MLPCTTLSSPSLRPFRRSRSNYRDQVLAGGRSEHRGPHRRALSFRLLVILGMLNFKLAPWITLDKKMSTVLLSSHSALIFSSVPLYFLPRPHLSIFTQWLIIAAQCQSLFIILALSFPLSSLSSPHLLPFLPLPPLVPFSSFPLPLISSPLLPSLYLHLSPLCISLFSPSLHSRWLIISALCSVPSPFFKNHYPIFY